MPSSVSEPLPTRVLHLRVAAEADPGVLARVIERFQNLNLTPRRVVAEWSSHDQLHILLEIAGLSEERLGVIAAKLGQLPTILTAYWHR